MSKFKLGSGLVTTGEASAPRVMNLVYVDLMKVLTGGVSG